MAVRFNIHKLDLRTATGSSSYEFAPGLNIVTGSYGTGKSSMFEIIKYTLGAKSAELMPAIATHLKVATLELTVGRHRIEMQRAIGQNRTRVTFLGEGNRVEQWSATRIKSAPLASDRLLELLDIPAIRLARRGASGSSVAVSFFDFWRYVYLPQEDVARSIAGHSDPFLDPKRKAVLKIAYGLSDELVSALEISVVEQQKLRDRTQLESEAVAAFLDRAGAPSPEEILEGVEAVELALASAQEVLAGARAATVSEVGANDQRQLRERVSRLRALSADYDSERLIAEVAVNRNEGVVAQLNLDLLREKKSLSVGTALLGFEFYQCPRCMQALPEEHAPGTCLLCGQSEPTEQEPHDMEALHNQLQEAIGLLESERLRYETALRSSQRYQQELRDAVEDLESQLVVDLVLPSVDRVSSATADVERLRARLRDLERFQDQWDAQAELVEEVRTLGQEIELTLAEIEEAKAALELNKFRLVSLAEYFQEEIRALGFGLDAVGEIDANFLPTINGDKFEQLSVSGARKVLANDAYYLASLGNALTDPGISLPGLLILDGPRTSLGDTVEDLSAGERLYYRFRLLADEYDSAQIIVADNGYPKLPGGSRPVNVIRLSYDQPLLQDVEHPGEGKVPTVGQTIA